MDLHVLSITESKKVICGMSSVCLSVCLSFCLSDCLSVCLCVCLYVCLSACVHYNSKYNWAISTKFGMWCYMIKISAGIVYEQNRLTGVASALMAQFVFLPKSALWMRCTIFFFSDKMCYKSQYATFAAKHFLISQVFACALMAQFVFFFFFLRFTKIVFRQKLLEIKTRNFYKR